MPRINYAARKKYGSYKNEIQTSKVTRLLIKDSDGQGVFPMATRRLYGMDATGIQPVTLWGTEANQVQYRRTTTRVYLGGIRYRIMVRSNTTGPLVFNYALISFKQNTRPIPNSTTYPAEPLTLPTLASDGFFRDYFLSNDVNASTALPGYMWNFNPINKDQYIVHMHKRCYLNCPDNSTWQTDGRSFKYLSAYVPVKKWIKYNDDTDVSCEDSIYFVYWCDSFMVGPDADHILDAAKIQAEILTYFNE